LNPLVTVVMPAYNAGKFIAEAIESILNQSYENIELIVVDDCSSDDTVSIVGKYLCHSRVRLILHDKNCGVSRTLNDGILAANGTYVARMDADDISLPRRIQTQVDFLSSNHGIAAVGTGAIVIDEAGQPFLKIVPPQSDPEIKEALLRSFPFVSGSLMFHRATLVKAGLFDPQVPGCEDLELAMRISEGNQLHNVPDLLYCWRKTILGESNITSLEMNRRSDLARRVFRAKKTGNTKELHAAYESFQHHYNVTTRESKSKNPTKMLNAYYRSLFLAGLKYGLPKKSLRCYAAEIRKTDPFLYWAGSLLSFIPGAIRTQLGRFYSFLNGGDKGKRSLTRMERDIKRFESI